MVLSWDQIASLLGAFLILLAYAIETLKPGRLNRWTFQLLNCFGALGLFVSALINVQYGFIILEGAWLLISIVAMIRLALAKNKPA